MLFRGCGSESLDAFIIFHAQYVMSPWKLLGTQFNSVTKLLFKFIICRINIEILCGALRER